jgi:anti-sigma B factor antagonist
MALHAVPDKPEGAAAPLLRIAQARGDGFVEIRLIGELDIGNCDQVRTALGDVAQASADRVVVELDELDFIDSSGIRELLHAWVDADANGTKLSMRHPTPIVRRVLEISGAIHVIEAD